MGTLLRQDEVKFKLNFYLPVEAAVCTTYPVSLSLLKSISLKYKIINNQP
jgi:hypothetical protein